MNEPAGPPATSSLQDIASSSEAAETVRLLKALRHLSGSSPLNLPGRIQRAVAQEARPQSHSIPTNGLRASVHRTLQLLDTRPPVDAKAYAASRRRLGTLMSERAVADDWIARLQARQRQSGRLDDAHTYKALDAEIQTRKEHRRRLIDRERHAERIVEEHERRLQALYDWQLDHLQQLVQGRWHAQTLLERQDRALGAVAATPPPYLLSMLGLPPRAAEAREVWRQGAPWRSCDSVRTITSRIPTEPWATPPHRVPSGFVTTGSRWSSTRPVSYSTNPTSRSR